MNINNKTLARYEQHPKPVHPMRNILFFWWRQASCPNISWYILLKSSNCNSFFSRLHHSRTKPCFVFKDAADIYLLVIKSTKFSSVSLRCSDFPTLSVELNQKPVCPPTDVSLLKMSKKYIILFLKQPGVGVFSKHYSNRRKQCICCGQYSALVLDVFFFGSQGF